MSSPRLHGGFTLIEVLVTLVILATAIVAVLEAFQTSLRALGSARDSLKATLLVREKMADLERQALSGGESAPASSSDRFSEGFYRGFRRDCDVRRVDVEAGADLKRDLFGAVVSVLGPDGQIEQVVTTYVSWPVKER